MPATTPRRLIIISLLTVSSVVLLGGGTVLLLEYLGITPRHLGAYLSKRVSDKHPTAQTAASTAGRFLELLDRAPGDAAGTGPALVIGAQPEAVAPAPGAGRVVDVKDVQGLRAALEKAQPGDLITLAPGNYLIRSGGLELRNSGSEARPIVVRAARPGTVRLDMAITEGFQVQAGWWQFENLAIHGACVNDSDCEHAFHITGDGHHFSARNNVVSDFNAHFKINGADGKFPDDGLIEGNTITNEHPRRTRNPIAPIDSVGASRWMVRANIISDFVRGVDGANTTGGFFKGAGKHNVFERNIVLCEQQLRGIPGSKVGLSLGNGGSAPQYCRDKQCAAETIDSTIRFNLIANCSDDGIYLNRAAGSTILHNTLIDTGGIVVRYPDSDAMLEGNLVDGAIRSRDEGRLRDEDNRSTGLSGAYAGKHPVRELFAGPGKLDLRWKEAAPRRAAIPSQRGDLCSATPKGDATYGAFADFKACLRNPDQERK